MHTYNTLHACIALHYIHTYIHACIQDSTSINTRTDTHTIPHMHYITYTHSNTIQYNAYIHTYIQYNTTHHNTIHTLHYIALYYNT